MGLCLPSPPLRHNWDMWRVLCFCCFSPHFIEPDVTHGNHYLQLHRLTKIYCTNNSLCRVFSFTFIVFPQDLIRSRTYLFLIQLSKLCATVKKIKRYFLWYRLMMETIKCFRYRETVKIERITHKKSLDK